MERDSRQILESACKLYCSWYDRGEPAMTAGAMAYDLVSLIRLALDRMPEDTEPKYERGWPVD